MTRKEQIAERIKTMRMSRGMSQQDLANALHCGQSTIAMYETGKRMPDPETIDYLADIFNVPPYSIMYSEDEMISAYNSAQQALDEIGDKLTAPSRSKKWITLSKGLGEIEKKNKNTFDAIYAFLTTAYPETFKERNDDDANDPES